MLIRELAERVGARIVAGEDGLDATVTEVCAGDRISDLLAQASSASLVVTNLAGTSLLRTAQLMDVPAICVVGDVEPEQAMNDVAERHGIALLVSPLNMFETCGRLYGVLKDGQ